jgi:putative flippase GtrA
MKDRQFILYGIIGASGAALDILCYIFLYKKLHISPYIATFMSVSIGILNNFILNSRHNFKVTDNLLHRFMRFYSIGLGGAVLSSGFIYVMFNLLSINATVAKLLTIPPVVLLQFFLNRKFTFKGAQP